MTKRKKLHISNKIERVKLNTPSNKHGANKLTTEHQLAVTNYFSGYERIAAIPALYFKGMGDRIEIYGLNSLYYVGAIYPDGATMIWPMSWSNGRKDFIEKEFYEHEPAYSSLMLKQRQRKKESTDVTAGAKKRGRVSLENNIIKKRVRKQKRVKLNA